VDTVELVDRHLIFLEVEIGEALPQDADQKVVGELILFRESRGRYGLEPGKKILIGLVALTDGRKRVLGELVVVPVVTEGGGALGEVAEVRLVLFFEERVLRGDSVTKRRDVLRGDAACDGDEEKQAVAKAHESPKLRGERWV